MSSFSWALENCLEKSERFGMVASGVEEGIFTVDIADKLLLFATKHCGSCSVWKADLSDDVILKHSEEDVGISDPSGVASFAPYFAGALKKNVFVEITTNSYPADLDSSVIFLRLDYKISSMQIDGLLKLSLVQRTPNLQFYRIMKLLYESDPDRKVFESTCIMGSFSFPASSSISYPTRTSDSLTTQDVSSSRSTEEGETEPHEAEEVVLKAKKRKATGVSLFNNKKR